jgi:hypothetical protein
MIRLLELLHTQPDVWAPYKELCLPDRVLNIITMNSEELRDMLTHLPIALTPTDLTMWEEGRKDTQEVFAECLEVLTQLLPLALPAVDSIDLGEITWAFTVVQTRAVLTDEESTRGFGTGHLVPLFDMLNHAPANTCTFVPLPHLAVRGLRASRAVQADPTRLSVASGPDGAELLMRDGRPLGRLDDCLIVRAPKGGLRAGEEVRFKYHDTAALGPKEKIAFALTYGFYPA